MSEADAYAAGLFDGEGHIAIAYRKGSGSGKNRYPRFILYISMSQNDRGAIEWLAGRYGGSARFVTGKRSYDNGMYERWNWILSTASACAFLKRIQPYSIVKAEEIKVALAFQETMDATRGRGKVPVEIVAFRRQCWEKIRECRKRKAA